MFASALDANWASVVLLCEALLTLSHINDRRNSFFLRTTRGQARGGPITGHLDAMPLSKVSNEQLSAYQKENVCFITQ